MSALSKDWGTSVGLGQHCSLGSTCWLLCMGSRAYLQLDYMLSFHPRRLSTSLKCLQGCKQTVLIADIGGTNCRFELWRVDSSGEKKHKELYHRASLYQRIS